MNILTRGVLTVYAMAALWPVPAPAARTTNGTLTEIRGEVVELNCYLADGRNKGPAHRICAREGITAGHPVGILTRMGELYLVIGKNMKTLNKLFAPYAAKQVKVTGKRFSRGRMLGIQFKSVEEIPADHNKKKARNAK